MSERDLYAVAVLVSRMPAGQQIHVHDKLGTITYECPDGDYWALSPEHVLLASSAIAGSEEEAKEKCIRKAREMYPESEGWDFYVASAQMALETTNFAATMRGQVSPRSLSGDERQMLQAVLLDLLLPEGDRA
jgi:hypothetical protein